MAMIFFRGTDFERTTKCHLRKKIVIDKCFLPRKQQGEPFVTVTRLITTTRANVQPNRPKMIVRFLFAIVFCLSAVVIAQADPLTLTSGSFTTFTDPGFWHNQASASGPNISFSAGASNNCDIGACFNLNILSSLDRPNALGGTLTIDGVTYNAFLISFSLSDNIVTGTISVFSDRDVPPGTPPLFTTSFIGHGFVTVTENPELRSTSTVFTITTATPEPASLILIGLGVSGLAIKFKR